MTDLIREATAGHLIRFITRKKFLKYPEEKDGFQLPSSYTNPAEQPPAPIEDDKTIDVPLAGIEAVQLSSPSSDAASEKRASIDLEKQKSHGSLKREISRPIAPTKTNDGNVLVDYYDTDDPNNPQNWSKGKKYLITFIVCLYTTSVYMGSSIYSPASQGVAEVFGVSLEVASLGLAIFVAGYAVGPMVWSPLSEWPAIGRNPPYIVTLGLFVILSVPTALVDNLAGLLVLRYFQGLFASPALATGAASLADMYPPSQAPYLISLWSWAGVCGPALGPLISGFSVQAKGWRWALWEELWLTGPLFLILFFFLPETYGPNVLLRRAKRIRALTGDTKYISQSEIDQKGMSVRQTAYDVLIKPIQLNAHDPSILFITIYTALMYGIYYSFFEAFPFVYGDMYHFSNGEQGLAFLSLAVGCGGSFICYWIYLYKVVDPQIARTGEMGSPEWRLVPALYASILLPIGLFIFAWTANPDVHWIGTLIGVVIFGWGVFIIIQGLFVYLAMSYPRYIASLFAGNNLGRSSGAVATIEISRPMFKGIGVGGGVSLLAGLCVLCVAGVFILWRFGAQLRARSKFAEKTGGH